MEIENATPESQEALAKLPPEPEPRTLGGLIWDYSIILGASALAAYGFWGALQDTWIYSLIDGWLKSQ